MMVRRMATDEPFQMVTPLFPDVHCRPKTVRDVFGEVALVYLGDPNLMNIGHQTAPQRVPLFCSLMLQQPTIDRID
jgi:hypothetical protein